jgi:hypothetical protein
MLNKTTTRRKGINVRDEKEFKIWVKLICSINKEGEDITKPLNILWKSVEEEIQILEKRAKNLDRILQS